MEKGDVEKCEIGNPLFCSYSEGQFIYKDPNTSNEFVWEEIAKKWIPKTVGILGTEVTFDTETQTYNYKDADGTTFEWDPNKSAWFPKGDESGGAQLPGGFLNPNYAATNTTGSEGEGRRRFYYAALSPSEMGVGDVLFLSPDDQVNSNYLPNNPPSLPPGWERHEDANGAYYWHIKSGTIQRDLPTGAVPALLIPGTLGQGTGTVSFRRSHTVSSQLSASSSSSSPTPAPPVQPTENKRKSWSQYLDDSPKVTSTTNQDKPLRFVAVSLGCLPIQEDDLTPERSSRAVSKVIAELTNPNNKLGLEVAGKIWGGGNELYLELVETHLRVRVKEGQLTVLDQPIHSIRVWGVGREDPRDFAFVAREKITRQFLCHVFRLEMYARPLANSLRDACKKIMIERQAKQKRPTSLPTGLRKHTSNQQTNNTAGLFPTPMDEPKKIINAFYLGSKIVNKANGMPTLNAAIDALGNRQPIPVQVSVAPSVIKITSEESDTPQVDLEVRVRFLSFLGIGTDVKTCGIIVHTAHDTFEAHCFYSNPSTGALCKAIEAACVLRFQKCLDAHHLPPGGGQSGASSGGSTGSVTSPKTSLASALKNLIFKSNSQEA